MACRTQNAKKRLANFDMIYFAWNEDTVLPYKYALARDSSFIYTIASKDNNNKIVTKRFYGKAQSKLDTIYLLYDKRIRPPKLTNFLIREITGNYLIQNDSNNTKRIFLRRYRLMRR